MERRVSQQTFDDAVRDNMDDFGLGEQEAIEETKRQFLLQCVNLNDIDFSSSSEKISVTNATNSYVNLARSCKNMGRLSDSDVVSLNSLVTVLLENFGANAKFVNIFVPDPLNSALDVMQILKPDEDAALLLDHCKLVLMILKHNSVAPKECGKDIIRFAYNLLSFLQQSIASPLISKCLQLIFECNKQIDGNKALSAKLGCGPLLHQLLLSTTIPNTVIVDIARCLKSMISNDDVSPSANASTAIETRKSLMSLGVLPVMIQHLNDVSEVSIYSCFRYLLATADSIQQIVNLAIMPRLLHQLSSSTDISLLSSIYALLRVMCLEDDVKIMISTDEILDRITHHTSVKELSGVCWGVLAQVTLRNPSASRILMSSTAFVDYLTSSRLSSCVQLVNNILSRCPEYKSVFVERGMIVEGESEVRRETVTMNFNPIQHVSDDFYESLQECIRSDCKL